MKALLLALILPLTSQAAIFDAPDILPENSGAVSTFGELLLSDPTSEGIEARGRYGLSEAITTSVILGTGTDGKRLRFGGELVYNFIPDWEGQLGISGLTGLQYLKRYSSGGAQFRLGLMIHKKVDGINGYPSTFYAALPFQLEARDDSVKSGSQIVLGSLVDFSSTFYASGEGGVKIGNADSYIMIGAGLRFGEVRFERRESRRNRDSSPTRLPSSQKESDVYREEDFY